jgi:hypothetical protein
VPSGNDRDKYNPVLFLAQETVGCFVKYTPSTHRLRVFYQHFTDVVSNKGQKVKLISQ